MKRDMLDILTTVVAGVTCGFICSAALLFFLNHMAESVRSFL